MPFAIKTGITDPTALTFAFQAQKTMYGCKHIAPGDTIYVFASENAGGAGLIARGVVTSAAAVPRKPSLARQTRRVSVTVRRTAVAQRHMGRRELRPLVDWVSGEPGAELNFKLYRQPTRSLAFQARRRPSWMALSEGLRH